LPSVRPVDTHRTQAMARRSCTRFALLGVVLAAIATLLSGCPRTSTKVHAPHRGSCFPADAVVISAAGPKRMADVQVGDSLLGMDATGKIEYSDVRAWLHRDVDAHSNMTVIETGIGQMVASAKHSIATDVAGRVKYAYADELEVGHTLFAKNGSAVHVLGTSSQAAAGFYSPLTYNSNFFVGSSADSVVLAHGFAHNPAPVFSAHIVHTLMNIAELLHGSSVHEISPEQQKRYLHPVLRAVLAVCPIVSIDAESEASSLWQWLRALRGAAADEGVQVNLV